MVVCRHANFEAGTALLFVRAGIGMLAVVHGWEYGCEEGWIDMFCGMLAQDHFKIVELRL